MNFKSQPDGPANINKADEPSLIYRLLAKAFDLSLSSIVCLIMLPFFIDFLWIFGSANLRAFLFVFYVSFSPFIFDSILTTLFGNSVGKSILSMKIIQHDSEDEKYSGGPKLISLLIRNFEIYVKGMGFNLPFINILCILYFWVQKSEGRDFPWNRRWDESILFSVIQNPINLARKVSFAILFITIFIILALASNAIYFSLKDDIFGIIMYER